MDSYSIVSGIYYYNEGAPDYTEGAATTLWAFSLFAQLYGQDYTDLRRRSALTIISRQCSNGAYFKSAPGSAVEIWYTDNIGDYLTRYIDHFAGKPHTITSEGWVFFNTLN